MSSAAPKVRVSIVGASGYTGAELVRLLLSHSNVDLRLLVGHGKAGLPISEVLPSLAGLREGTIEPYDLDRIARESDAVFTALPHGASGKIVAELRERGLIVFDLSADFRLHEPERHQKWYGEDHSPALREQAVYGLVELHRDAIAKTDLIAVPGCFPTASILPVAPLLKFGLVEAQNIIVDAKTGISGAG